MAKYIEYDDVIDKILSFADWANDTGLGMEGRNKYLFELYEKVRDMSVIDMFVETDDDEAVWIPTSDRLPDVYSDKARYVVTIAHFHKNVFKREITTAVYDATGNVPKWVFDKNEDLNGYRVVAWIDKKIPEPYISC